MDSARSSESLNLGEDYVSKPMTIGFGEHKTGTTMNGTFNFSGKIIVKVSSSSVQPYAYKK